MITIIDMVTGKITKQSSGQDGPAEQVVPYRLPAVPMLQEITLQAEHRANGIPADLVTTSVDKFLRNR